MKEKTKEVVVGSTDWLNTLDDRAVLRERELLRSAKNPHGLLPMSRSRWWSGVASGAHPAPVRLGPKITGWRASDIRDWLSMQLELSSNQTGALRLGPKRLKTLKATAAQKGLELTLVRRADSGSYLFLLAGAGATHVLATPAEVETHLSACPVQEGVAVATYMRKELGIDHMVIDSLMKCGIGTDDYTAQKEFVNDLCSVAQET